MIGFLLLPRGVYVSSSVLAMSAQLITGDIDGVIVIADWVDLRSGGVSRISTMFLNILYPLCSILIVFLKVSLASRVVYAAYVYLSSCLL